jgi:hypothetical protein
MCFLNNGGCVSSIIRHSDRAAEEKIDVQFDSPKKYLNILYQENGMLFYLILELVAHRKITEFESNMTFLKKN